MKRSIHIEYSWWRDDADGGRLPVVAEDKDHLDEHAHARIFDLFQGGFIAGELHDGNHRGWWTATFNGEPDSDLVPIWRCTWCCKDTATVPCEHCGNDSSATDRTKPHRPEWSRASMQEVECKVCDRRGPYAIQRESAWCDSRNNPNIKGIHEPT